MASGLISTALPTVEQTTQVPSIATAAVPTIQAPTVQSLTVAAPTASATPANVSSVAQPTAVQPRQVAEQETVAGQLNKLLAGDSTYIQSARNAGLAQANSRGLINSSLAAGTAEKAAIDASLPIAQQDATTYSQAGLSAQTANQDLGLTGYKSLLDAAQQRENFGYTTAQNQQNIQGNLQIQKQAQDAAAALKQLDINLAQTQLTAQQKQNVMNAASPIIQQVQSEISLIQRTPDEQMSPQAKSDAINYQQQSLQAQLATLSSLYGYSIDWTTPGAAGGTATAGGGGIPAGTQGTPPTNPIDTAVNQVKENFNKDSNQPGSTGYQYHG